VSYRVIFKQAAQWEFERLTQGQRKAIAAKIDELETNPEPPGAIRLAGYPKFWRIAARNVWAKYLAPLPNGVIYILRVATRNSAYAELAPLLHLIPPD
jgi:mRNA-degrading endonuclease RelE of RelBE toxin-antitoxin system